MLQALIRTHTGDRHRTNTLSTRPALHNLKRTPGRVSICDFGCAKLLRITTPSIVLIEGAPTCLEEPQHCLSSPRALTRCLLVSKHSGTLLNFWTFAWRLASPTQCFYCLNFHSLSQVSISTCISSDTHRGCVRISPRCACALEGHFNSFFDDFFLYGISTCFSLTLQLSPIILLELVWGTRLDFCQVFHYIAA